MDSINRQQAEPNRKDVSGTQAIARIKDVVDKNGTCFFCTASPIGPSNGARPMSVRKVDELGRLWFLSADDSYKNEEIDADPSVRLFFQGSEHSDFLQLDGRVTISRDPEMIEELWNPVINTWFTGGKDDPRVTVLMVEPTDGYYWDNKHGNTIAGIKMLLGAATGKTLDDSIEGTVKV